MKIIKTKIRAHKNWSVIEDYLQTKFNDVYPELMLITFCDLYFIKNSDIVDQPWVGIVHDPPETELVYRDRNLLKRQNFKQSLEWCCGLFCMSKDLVKWIMTELNPSFFVKFIYHPIYKKPNLTWEPHQFNGKIFQIGNWLRRTYSIYLISTSFQKIILPFNSRLQDELNFWCRRDSIKINDKEITKMDKLSNDQYYEVFTNSVVFLNLFASTVNNVILECIHFNTPIIVNRLPAIEEYLGVNYPLFYDKLEEINLFTLDSFITAHDYLKKLNKSRFNIDIFYKTINN